MQASDRVEVFSRFLRSFTLVDAEACRAGFPIDKDTCAHDPSPQSEKFSMRSMFLAFYVLGQACWRNPSAKMALGSANCQRQIIPANKRNTSGI